MALIDCPECKKEISDSAKSCPLCGYVVPSKKAESVFKKKLSKTELVFYVIIGVLILFWVANSELKDKKVNTPRPSNKVVYNSPSGVSVIPSNLKYVIHKDVKNPKTLDVILNQTLSEDTLKVLDTMLRKTEKIGDRDILISYYLPNKTTISWAISDFGPGHKIKIRGLTPEIEAKLVEIAQDHPGKRIGQWVCDDSVVTIYREGSSIFLDTIHKDNSRGIKKVIEKQTKEGRRFDFLEARATGDYYLINDGGDLECSDESGLIVISRNIKSGRIWPLPQGQ